MGRQALYGAAKLYMGPPSSIWGRQALYGAAKLYMGPSSSIWGRQALYGATKRYMGPPSSIWGHQALYGAVKLYMGPPSSIWGRQALYGAVKLYMGLPSSIWGCQALYGAAKRYMGPPSSIWGHQAQAIKRSAGSSNQLILHQLVRSTAHVSICCYNNDLTTAMYLLAFHAFLKIGEIAVTSAAQPNSVLQLNQLAITTEECTVVFHSYKHYQGPPAGYEKWKVVFALTNGLAMHREEDYLQHFTH